jgi:NAD(P)-dependent dehydrogenase (short-subunit alcohol dehydrogenase family)
MTKQANLLFTKEIACRWKSLGIQSYAPHPGMVRTNFFASTPSTTRIIIDMIWWLLGKNCEQGAQTQIYCCVQDNLTNGGYFMDCIEVSTIYRFYLHRKMQVMGLLKNNSLHKNEYFHYISWFTTSQ